MQKFKGDLLNVIANKASRLKAARSRQAKPSFVLSVCLFFFLFFFFSKVGAGIPLQKFIGMIILSFKHMVGMTNTFFYYFSFFYWQAYGILYLATFLRRLHTILRFFYDRWSCLTYFLIRYYSVIRFLTYLMNLYIHLFIIYYYYYFYCFWNKCERSRFSL